MSCYETYDFKNKAFFKILILTVTKMEAISQPAAEEAERETEAKQEPDSNVKTKSIDETKDKNQI